VVFVAWYQGGDKAKGYWSEYKERKKQEKKEQEAKAKLRQNKKRRRK